MVGADESTTLDGPWDGPAGFGVCISTLGPSQTVMSAAYPRRHIGRKEHGALVRDHCSMMMKVEKYIYITTAAKTIPCFSFFSRSSASAHPGPLHTRCSAPCPLSDARS